MKKTNRFLSVLLSFAIIFSCVGFFAYADDVKTYYYLDSVNGDDSNSGTDINSPVKTIAGLKNLDIGPGTHFLFKNGGEYECAVTLTCSGTKENPVVISSYGEGEKAVLKTNERTEVFRLFDCSYVTISDLHIHAPNGGGIWIDTLSQTSEGIIIDNVYFTDMQNFTVKSRDDFSNGAASARAAVMVKGLPARSRYAVNDLTIRNCEVYNCANGFMIWGSWNDEQAPWCAEEDIDPIYNEGVLVENCYFHEMDAEAVVVGICDGALVTHCRAINCCQGDGLKENGEIGYFTAAMWFWGSENSTIQYCEIAGQKNVGDGMSIDFDSHSNNCTYQYIYSHDNMRFMCNNANYSGQYNNTVRYCLSVNDGAGRSKTSTDAGEYNFKFYNNTIINCGEFQITGLYDSFFANNIIIPVDGNKIYYKTEQILESNTIFSNNCYYNCPTPFFDALSKNTYPAFVGGEGIDAYKLASNSPLIGCGYEVEDDLTLDFFGNEISSANIGCYGAEGEAEKGETENIIEKIIRYFKMMYYIIIREIRVLIEDLSE